MKTIKLIVVLLACPLVFNGQELTGLWTGTLSNDSTTVRKDQSFEIALTQYREKVYGYSRSTFIVNDTLYYILKRVKGTIKDDVCEVEDDDIISYNFPGKLEKGVKVTHTFRLNKGDSTWRLDGEWKTNKTKKFYAISGKVDLKEEKNLDLSKIFPHLEELGYAEKIPFYADSRKKENSRNTQVASSSNKTPTNNNQSKTSKPQTGSDKDVIAVSKKDNPVSSTPVPQKEIAAANIKNQPANNRTQPQIPVAKPDPSYVHVIDAPKPIIPEANPATVDHKTQDIKSKPDIAVTTAPAASVVNTGVNTNVASAPVSQMANDQKVQPKNEFVEISKTDPSAPAAFVKERKTEAQQIVEYKSDSLVLILYDNGEVDGDTVSVLMDNEVIISKQCLKTSALRKTIYLDRSKPEVNIVLYAENLGKYPPNTGLLVVYDGEDRYQVRFSADLQKNAGIIFKRKPQ